MKTVRMASHTHNAQVGRLEVVETGRRRRWSEEEKLRIVTESLIGPRLVSATANTSWPVARNEAEGVPATHNNGLAYWFQSRRVYRVDIPWSELMGGRPRVAKRVPAMTDIWF